MVDYFVLCKSVSDYHEMIHGVPLQLVGESDEHIYAIQTTIEKYVEAMTMTFAGREALRAKGWQINETSKDFQLLAEHFEMMRQMSDDDVQYKSKADN